LQKLGLIGLIEKWMIVEWGVGEWLIEMKGGYVKDSPGL